MHLTRMRTITLLHFVLCTTIVCCMMYAMRIHMHGPSCVWCVLGISISKNETNRNDIRKTNEKSKSILWELARNPSLELSKRKRWSEGDIEKTLWNVRRSTYRLWLIDFNWSKSLSASPPSIWLNEDWWQWIVDPCVRFGPCKCSLAQNENNSLAFHEHFNKNKWQQYRRECVWHKTSF